MGKTKRSRSLFAINCCLPPVPRVRRAVHGISQPLIVTVYGGEVLVEGVEVQSSSADSAAITDGGEYLLRDGNIVFKDAYEVALPEVVSQIEAAARLR